MTPDRRHAAVALTAGAAAVVAILVGVRGIALVEAGLSSWFIRVTGLADARTVGTAVIYDMHDRWVGFAVTGGCSVALLLIPPFAVAAGLISLRRLSWRRGLVATGWAAALLVAVNQVRLFVIAASMRYWGFRIGYERSHILIGSGITTVGMALVTIIFVMFVARAKESRYAT